MRRLAGLQLSLALLGLAYAGRASPTAAAKARVKPAPFASYASGFGTRLIGGDVPADSAKTAGTVLGCTDLGNIRRGNNIAYITLIDTPLGSVFTKGLIATARTESREGELDASTPIGIGRIIVQPAGGLPAQTLPAPSPRQPVTIPGLVTLEPGRPLTRDKADVARSVASSLQVTLIPSATKVTVGNARARVERGARTGIVSGFERVGVARTTANGEAQELPSPGDTLEIPGLASVTPHVVARSRNDIEVVGLRNQLVEGDLATVDLAVSRMKLGKGVIRR